MDAPEWFFAWVKGSPYITQICSWSRRGLIQSVERETGRKWKNIYQSGGRAMRCTVTPNVKHDRRTAALSPGVRVDGPVGPRAEE
jgi:hypothetical protein